MKIKSTVISFIISLCLLVSVSTNAFAETSLQGGNSNDAAINQSIKKSNITITKVTVTTDKSTGVINKVIEFEYNPVINSKSGTVQTNQMKVAATGVFRVSLTPDYYSHSVEIDWTLISSGPLFGYGTVSCLMDGNSSLTKSVMIAPGGLSTVYGQFNYYFGKAGSHSCDLTCSYVDANGPICPVTGWIPFSV